MKTTKLELRFPSELLREARIQGKRFNRTRNEQLLHWINMGKCLDDVLFNTGVESVTKFSAVERLTAHYDQLFKSMNTPAARAKAKEALDAGPEAFRRPLESHEQQVPALEAWLHNNPAALASVKKGLKASAEGKTAYLGSFADAKKQSSGRGRSTK